MHPKKMKGRYIILLGVAMLTAVYFMDPLYLDSIGRAKKRPPPGARLNKHIQTQVL